MYRDESRTQGLDRLELIRRLQVAQTLTVHHGALASLLGINAQRASEAAAVRIEDYAETMRGHRVLHLVGKGNKPATMPITVPVLPWVGEVIDECVGFPTAAHDDVDALSQALKRLLVMPLLAGQDPGDRTGVATHSDLDAWARFGSDIP